MNGSEYVLEIHDVVKRFPGVLALDQVNFSLRKGTVHALMGENGAGKSTLMKCLLGVYHMDSGQISLHGEPVTILNPADAIRHGLSMIHQELNPIPKRSVCDNIWLGRELRKGIHLDQTEMMRQSRDILSRLHIKVNPAKLMGSLSVAQMQMVEIAKAVSYNAEIIIMDEPTSALTEAEIRSLFTVIEELKAANKAVIYISHKIDEIFEICDDVTVFRDGKNAGFATVKDATPQGLISMMVGRKVNNIYPKVDCPIKGPVLKVEHLSSGETFQDISFTVHKGEIFGFYGLVGAGRTEVCETLFGMREKSAGTIQLNGKNIKIKSPKDAIRHGIGMVTEDRRASGIFPVLSVLDNISIANLKKYCNRLYKINHVALRKEAIAFGDELRIKMPGYGARIMNLSGGNQQKTIVARWLMMQPDILIVDEPTRGIDVGAKAEIHSLITKLAGEGKAIIMISSEMPEVMGMSDRILVMHEGKMTGIIKRPDFTQERIMELAIK
ncbi:sugar ABC transporter ATP-binding protein [Sediminispirochaeta smaragdinae]|uniref:Ribose/galactose/methyl galactoside import ATP-binding protein n=1 Tax=Sediminispirochaeta smaragdinae (strain DSM 11293 / JCM 15392 / SEBR 4228) TaxID=573413 RepID=E1R0Z9_SEDSS|nr:sugar ABC transporter ATP-binding protein [Sediminispirochaeta smaragdinae]ADK80248.1 ABC transporter related protein [Sediminispirochaeta smaragdinae DSM 11293]